ncbi:MAG: putative copper-exporting P-type ATPase B [Parcubacteria group bacterium Gr01-1014_33]|nr:MAG: putative copper-exporting P-type ATPase B [Parcubacteria group bacterium Gr01-1014_33]
MSHCHNHQKTLSQDTSVKGNFIYTCPMHPEIKREMPGMCPECGMALVPIKGENHGGAGTHEGHTTALFLKKFWVSALLAIPVVLYSDILEILFGFKAPAFPGSHYVPLLLGSLVFFYGGWIFLQSAAREARARLPGMMTLIALAISVAFIYSIGVAGLGRPQEGLFWELATLITIMLLGHWLEMRAVSGAQGALKELSKLLPDTAELIIEGGTKKVPLDTLKEGDMVFVRPGGRIPVDGVVSEGKSDVNESMVTGESAPVSKILGDAVIAGTINSDGSLTIRVAKVGAHTFLAGIMRLIEEAQASKSRLQMLSDRAAYFLTLLAVGTGGATLLFWIFAKGDVGFALERMVAVLVIACPHALGLAIPLVASISTTLAARHGFLVRARLALEMARNVNVVLFDKTGTLTKGEYGVTALWAQAPVDEAALLRFAASVDSHSEHFISKAIVARAKEKGVPLADVKEFVRLPGRGVKGMVEGEEIYVGGFPILRETGASIPEDLREKIDQEHRAGNTIIFAVRNAAFLGAFALSDIIRKESREAIAQLKDMGVRIAMVTGDSEGVAAWVAGELGINEYFAKVLPHEKSEKVKLLQQKGAKVAMVGDGINDAPALTQADLGIAIGAGTNVAIESAGIILVRNDPRDIAKIIRLSRLTYRKMLQNLFWATGYNVVALPLAAGALASYGIFLEPAVAALFMSLSTVIVAANAVLLRRAVL